MFPLGSVLYPHGALPLRVFEPRYLALTRDCLAGDGRFGVVLIERGPEVGGGDQRFSVGTEARIVQVAKVDDRTLAMLAVGERRIRVERWLEDDPYPTAEVRVFPDAGGGDGARVADVQRSLRRVLALYSELGADVAGAPTELDPDPEAASYQAAALAGLGPLDAQRVLEIPGAGERLRRLDGLLAELANDLERRLGQD